MGGKYDLQVDGMGRFRRIICFAEAFSLFVGGVLEAIPPWRSQGHPPGERPQAPNSDFLELFRASACSTRESSKQARQRYHDVAEVMANHRWPDTIRAFAYPSRNHAHQKRSDGRLKNNASMKLIVHGDKAIGPGKKDGSDDEPPAEVRAGQAPRFPQRAVQQGLIHAPEYKFLGEAGHNKEEGPA